MRKLWEDHITWTRLFIVSAVAELPDKGPTTNRLLQNQVDIFGKEQHYTQRLLLRLCKPTYRSVSIGAHRNCLSYSPRQQEKALLKYDET